MGTCAGAGRDEGVDEAQLVAADAALGQQPFLNRGTLLYSRSLCGQHSTKLCLAQVGALAGRSSCQRTMAASHLPTRLCAAGPSHSRWRPRTGGHHLCPPGHRASTRPVVPQPAPLGPLPTAAEQRQLGAGPGFAGMGLHSRPTVFGLTAFSRLQLDPAAVGRMKVPQTRSGAAALPTRFSVDTSKLAADMPLTQEVGRLPPPLVLFF